MSKFPRETIVLLSAIVGALIPGLLNLPAPANSEALGDVFNRAWYGSSNNDGCQQRQSEPSTTARTDIPYYENDRRPHPQPLAAAAPVDAVAPVVTRTQVSTAPTGAISPFGMTDAQIAAEIEYDRRRRAGSKFRKCDQGSDGQTYCGAG